jgi:hypothetical protein
MWDQVPQKSDLGAVVGWKQVAVKAELVGAEGHKDGFIVDLAACQEQLEGNIA